MPLSPAEEQEYIFLRRQVDYYQDLRFSRDAPKDIASKLYQARIASKLYQAREDLRAFVEQKRRNGIQI